ncbi:hypothetical protein V9W64_10870 [Neisseria leonii]|uniref:Uncharacterized protein n=1 Tax=Neisseria leonii TaxID=2995413 RepID=A0A9X4E0J0_9NEIS|nr:hypothetical protein [Neisseria sp. 51.81]MDD9326744.1 hypothetical protein [Neisseria sp. 51.81]
MRIRVTQARKKDSGLALYEAKLTKKTAEAMVQAAAEVLYEAAKHTPKYSGETTASWTVTDRPRQGYRTGAQEGNVSEPKYPQGIRDAAAMPLNMGVAWKGEQEARKIVNRDLRTKKGRTKLYITNTQEIASVWLTGNSLSAQYLLRAVNHDYYTLADLRQVALRAKNKLKVF